MENNVGKAPKIVEEIVAVIRSGAEKKQLLQRLDDYHANDIAQSLSLSLIHISEPTRP